MRSLAVAYALLVALAMPALLWAAEEAPPTATTLAQTTPAATTPAEAPAATTPAPPAATTPAEAPPPAADPPARTKAAREAREPTVADDRADEKPAARAAAPGRVTIEDFAFVPRTITVDEGDSVTWTNRDGVGHTATAEDGSFDTGMLAEGESGSHTFETAGTYRYQCTPHPNMTGTVVVRAASTGSGADATGEAVGDDTASDDGAGTSSSGSSGSNLPATGLEVGVVLLGGVLLLGAGALLRRRLDA